MEVMSFDDAISESDERGGKRHLLLGNGFSIACRPELFAYGRLFDEASFDDLTIDKNALFGIAGTSDFERAIEALKTSAAVLELYPDADPDIISALASDAGVVQGALADVLARKHPDHVGLIDDDEYASAWSFLVHFTDKIYTLNYDLLLYWTLLKNMGTSVNHDDGFRTDPNDFDAEWVIWDGYAGHIKPRIYYLHGGLHLYDAGSTLKKLTWNRTGEPLVDQIRSALAEQTYPLVVTEGTSEEKLSRIEHSPYLHRGLKSLQNIGGTLFIFGHSLAENDEHILARVERSNVNHVYISLFGDPDCQVNQAIRHRAGLMVEHRAVNEEDRSGRQRNSLEVGFYDAESAGLWDGMR